MLFMKEASLWGTLFTVSIGINAVYAQGHYPITGTFILVLNQYILI